VALTSPVPNANPVTASFATMVSIAVAVAMDGGVEAFPALFAVIVIIPENVPVGVPEIVQLAVAALVVMVRPGTAGESWQLLNAPAPPMLANVWLNATPTSPVPGTKLKEKAELTIRVSVVVASCWGTLLSLTAMPMVKVPVDVAPGVPLITHVLPMAVMVIPAGRPEALHP
jgi:hypothetical protein